MPKSNRVAYLELDTSGATEPVDGEDCGGVLATTCVGPLDVYAWSFDGTYTPISGTGDTREGTFTTSDLKFTTSLTAATEPLLGDAQTGQAFQSARLFLELPNGDQIDYTFDQLLIGSITVSDDGSSPTANPLIDLTLSFSKVRSATDLQESTPPTIVPGWGPQVKKTS